MKYWLKLWDIQYADFLLITIITISLTEFNFYMAFLNWNGILLGMQYNNKMASWYDWTWRIYVYFQRHIGFHEQYLICYWMQLETNSLPHQFMNLILAMAELFLSYFLSVMFHSIWHRDGNLKLRNQRFLRSW